MHGFISKWFNTKKFDLKAESLQLSGRVRGGSMEGVELEGALEDMDWDKQRSLDGMNQGDISQRCCVTADMHSIQK